MLVPIPGANVVHCRPFRHVSVGGHVRVPSVHDHDHRARDRRDPADDSRDSHDRDDLLLLPLNCSRVWDPKFNNRHPGDYAITDVNHHSLDQETWAKSPGGGGKSTSSNGCS